MNGKGRAVLFTLAALCSVLFFAGCAEREPEETEPRETVQPEYDLDELRREYEKREDQKGFIPYYSKYGYTLPEIRSWTDGFEDYLGESVTFTEPYDGWMPDFLADDRGGVYVFRQLRGDAMYDDITEAFLPELSNVWDGIAYYDAEGNASRVCEDPDCTLMNRCTHSMILNDSFIRYWNGCLYFTGARVEEDQSVHSYVMRFDTETRVFSKVIEFFDQNCFMFVIRGGVLYMTTGTVNDHWLCSVDLREGVACRLHIGQAEACGLAEGKIVLQGNVIGKRWNEVEHTVYTLDPQTGEHRFLDTYTAGYAGAAGEYAVYLKKWARGVSADLMRRDPNADNPEVMGRDVFKFRMNGSRCIWLCADGTLWRSSVVLYKPRKIASGVIDFRIQDDGRILFLAAKRFPGVREVGIENVSGATLYISNGFHKEAVWTASGSLRWHGQGVVAQKNAFLTCMYTELTSPNEIEYRETQCSRIDLEEETRVVLFRRYYSYRHEMLASCHVYADDHAIVYYSQKPK